MAGENTNTWTVYALVVLIFLVAVFWLYFFVYYPTLKEGATEMDAQAKCTKLSEIRGTINSIELIGAGPSAISPSLKSTYLLQLPAGCGVKYKHPCNTTSDCETKIREALDICWTYMEKDPESQGTCLTSLEVNKTLVTGNSLNKNPVCGGGSKCTGTEVPNNRISYDTAPQGGDSIAMEWGPNWWDLIGWGDRVIKVKCQGKCKP